ncbi:OmpA family protein [Roseobacter sp. HKCCD9010]|uniref:OmpA family protein n=1 Tax=unclassified Roseobacter TaxID=196798 RepID=UPI001492BFB7|nr:MULTISPECIES: OmpA family protein [unclassified Roseobacter]MBF9048694.1 OmpA family protein [Rhodobacterales bacterium HKCCD4356]NNV10693.1 OmpA family protein [Roseobacter sp. HKCCD7357]NNV14878.1 OmpA family protein [Roseobacter sp. HKCCD8768]NNV24337.1 OmpA family protein [Roseobacter sp. HKCCD8192]NNV28594.1 OmpA family protein [Roseobacter sp. HKCCD9061]
MSKISTLIAALAFVVAGALCVIVAVVAALRIEDRSTEAVAFAMREEGLDWVSVEADGLQVQLIGTAPDEAARFRALARAGAVVDADRVIDALDVTEPDSVAPPRFSLEMLRNGDGISLIGLVPEAIGREAVADGISGIRDGVEVANMVETATYPIPADWEAAMAFGFRALNELPRSQISVFDGRVEVTAVSESIEERRRYLAALNRARPDGVEVIMDISAPRPVITPFTLRFVRDLDSAHFEACSADTVTTRAAILSAAREAGLNGPENCVIGIGVPSPRWAEAVTIGMEALTALGAGTLTFSDADVTLIAAEGTPQGLFDRVIGELDADLPPVFSLHGVLPEPPEDSDEEGPPSFVATRSPEGYVQLRGRLPDDQAERAIYAYARATLGRDDTYLATRNDDDLPDGWVIRVLAGLEALALLNNGSLTVEPGLVSIRGNTGSQSAVSDLSRLLSEKLGEADNYEIDVTYQELLDPTANIPTAEECVARITTLLGERKITFDPGSVEINETSGEILDQIAEMLPDCRHARMEIGGHTDSQGREVMNLNLSQARADAVLNGLLARGVLVSNLTAQGYGETQPIDDNGTEEGRERNRRIEFRLLAGGVPSSQRETAEDPAEEAAAEADDPPAEEGSDEQN